MADGTLAVCLKLEMNLLNFSRLHHTPYQIIVPEGGLSTLLAISKASEGGLFT
jgi:hypothetical protein